MRRWLVGVPLVVLACGPAQSADDVAARQACYLEAESRFAMSVAACDGPWLDCPERETIMRQLRTDQEACP